MDAATGQTTFGAAGVPDVQQYLPLFLTEREFRTCGLGWVGKRQTC